MGGMFCICAHFKALMCSQSQVKELEGENSKLQLQVKELNEEYRTRLVCYLQDLAVSSWTNTHMSIKSFSTTSAPTVTFICMCFSFRSTSMQWEILKALQREVRWRCLWTICFEMFVHLTGSGRNSLPLLLAPIRRDYRRSPRPIMPYLLHTGDSLYMKCSAIIFFGHVFACPNFQIIYTKP